VKIETAIIDNSTNHNIVNHISGKPKTSKHKMTSTEVDVNLLSDFGQTQKCGTINEVYS
jgi:hypothetical protein